MRTTPTPTPKPMSDKAAYWQARKANALRERERQIAFARLAGAQSYPASRKARDIYGHRGGSRDHS